MFATKKHYVVYAALVVLCGGMLCTLGHASPNLRTKIVAPGVTLGEEIDSVPPEIIHVLTVDPTVSGVHISVIPGLDTVTGPTGDIHQGREEVRLTAYRHNAVAAVNGDYFPLTGDPYGAAVWDGNLYSEPYPGRSVMAICGDGRSVLFDTLDFLGELQTESNALTAITGVDRMVSSTDKNDLVVFTPTFGPRSGIRPGCTEVVLTGVNLPLRPSKLLIGTVSSINSNVMVGSGIPADGVTLAALPNGSASSFLTSNLHIGDKVELVCAMAPEAALPDALKLSFLNRDANDLPIEPVPDPDPLAYKWATVSEVVGGGPHLIVSGAIDIDGTAEGFTDSFISDPNPRTAIGVTADGKLLLVTVDGRQALSKGLTLTDLAKLMQRLGAYNAINLDGGGSTTMAVQGLLVNSLASTGYERPVADSVCVFSNSSQTPPSTNSGAPGDVPPAQLTQPSVAPPSVATIVGVPPTMAPGDIASLSLNIGGHLLPGGSPAIIWGGAVGSGIAFVNQSGALTALLGGQGMVTAYYNGAIIQQPITVNAPADGTFPPLISGNITIIDPSKPKNCVLTVGVFDANGMPVVGERIAVTVSRGKADTMNLTTNIDGYAETSIHWSGSKGSVSLSANSLITKTIDQPAQ